jgi:hypothetical protein
MLGKTRMTISEKGNKMSNVEIELYNGKCAKYENARYRVHGNKYVVTRNGRAIVQIDRVHVFDIRFASAGFLSTSVRTSGAVRGNARTGS